jgi:UDP-N-acetylmuramate dehydrogenase
MLQRHAYRGPHLAGRAPADGVDYQHGGSGLGQCGIHFSRGACFFYAGAAQLFAHRDKHDLWIHWFLLGEQLVVHNRYQFDCTVVERGTPPAAVAGFEYSGDVNFRENISLAQYTTLQVGGPARWLVEASDEDEVLAAVRFAREQKAGCFILGGGSNLLVSDDGFSGVVIRIASQAFAWTDERDGTATIAVGAGVGWDSVVRLAVEKNCAGIECLAGIPGSVGGTPVQNVGAYGQEVSRVIAEVRAFDLETESVVQLSPAECGFGYRRSIFNSTAKERYAITQVSYALRLDAPPQLAYRDVRHYFAERAIRQPTLAETAAAVREIRARKGMLLDEADADSRSAGSFFKNPVVPTGRVPGLAAIAQCHPDEVPQFAAGVDGMVKISAAWMIELAGFRKGFAMGRAALSNKHVLAIVNLGGATAAEIVALRDSVVAAVFARTGIRLEQEPVTLGFSR